MVELIPQKKNYFTNTLQPCICKYFQLWKFPVLEYVYLLLTLSISCWAGFFISVLRRGEPVAMATCQVATWLKSVFWDLERWTVGTWVCLNRPAFSLLSSVWLPQWNLKSFCFMPHTSATGPCISLFCSLYSPTIVPCHDYVCWDWGVSTIEQYTISAVLPTTRDLPLPQTLQLPQHMYMRNVIPFGGNMDLSQLYVSYWLKHVLRARIISRFDCSYHSCKHPTWAQSLSCRVQVCLRPPQAVEAARLAPRVRRLLSRSSLMMDWMMSWWEMRRIGWSWPRWQRQRENRRCTIGGCVCVCVRVCVRTTSAVSQRLVKMFV